MFKKVAHFIIWKEDIKVLIDSIAAFCEVHPTLCKDKESYYVNVTFNRKDYGHFLAIWLRLSSNGMEFRNPDIRTMIFGLEL